MTGGGKRYEVCPHCGKKGAYARLIRLAPLRRVMTCRYCRRAWSA